MNKLEANKYQIDCLNGQKWVKEISLYASIVITFCFLAAFFSEVITQDHAYFTPLSIFSFFLASYLCSILASLPSIVAQFAALYSNIFFFQRLLLVYFFPGWMDYKMPLSNNVDLIEWAAIFFFGCFLALFIGILLPIAFRSAIQRKKNSRRVSFPVDKVFFGFFNIKASWATVINCAIFVSVPLLILQVYIHIYLSIGKTGDLLLNTNFNSYIALTHQIKSFLPLAVFALVMSLHLDDMKLRRQTLVLVTICCISSLIMASRSFLLIFILYFYFSMCLIGLNDQKKYALLIIRLGILAIILFPLITYFRAYQLGAEYTLIEQLEAFNPIYEISGRVGSAIEAYFLWFNYLQVEATESLPTIYSELIKLINALVPGELIAESEIVNIAKLQVFIGRPDIPGYRTMEFMQQSGGHGEVIGQYGLSFLLYGYFSPFIFFITGFIASLIEHSKIQKFWIFYWALFFVTTPSLLPTYATLQEIVVIIFLIYFSYFFEKFKKYYSIR